MATDETIPATHPASLPADEDGWKVRLTPAEFRVLRQAGTEAPWTGEYVDTKTPGTYECRACGARLYESGTKFDSHCGWPSFTSGREDALKYVEDRSHGMARTEVRCARCDSHLGHVFYGEGLTPENTRHCINSLSIRLEPHAVPENGA